MSFFIIKRYDFFDNDDPRISTSGLSVQHMIYYFESRFRAAFAALRAQRDDEPLVNWWVENILDELVSLHRSCFSIYLSIEQAMLLQLIGGSTCNAQTLHIPVIVRSLSASWLSGGLGDQGFKIDTSFWLLLDIPPAPNDPAAVVPEYKRNWWDDPEHNNVPQLTPRNLTQMVRWHYQQYPNIPVPQPPGIYDPIFQWPHNALLESPDRAHDCDCTRCLLYRSLLVCFTVFLAEIWNMVRALIDQMANMQAEEQLRAEVLWTMYEAAINAEHAEWSNRQPDGGPEDSPPPPGSADWHRGPPMHDRTRTKGAQMVPVDLKAVFEESELANVVGNGHSGETAGAKGKPVKGKGKGRETVARMCTIH